MAIGADLALFAFRAFRCFTPPTLHATGCLVQSQYEVLASHDFGWKHATMAAKRRQITGTAEIEMNSQRDTEWWSDLPRTSFGSPEMEVRLAALIVSGRKRATVWDAAQDNPTKPGMRWIVTAGDRPVAVIETVTVGQCSFSSIDKDFAFEEGEGDRSLVFWKAVHETFFRNAGHFAPDMMLWCETFRLIEAIDTAFAEAASAHVLAEQVEGEALVAGLCPQER
jgi:uncharacterized protein YhfF